MDGSAMRPRFLSLLLQCGQPVRFCPRYLTGLSTCCIWAMSSKSRKEVGARVWLHLTPSRSAPRPVWHGRRTGLSAAPLQAVLNDSRRTAAASQIVWSVAWALSCFIRISWVLMGHTLPGVPTACMYPKLLLIGGPVAGARRLSK